MANKTIKIFCDGGSRGNPGPSAAGVVFLTTDDEVLAEYNEYLGIQTNNYAEYSAVLLGLKNINNFEHEKLEFYKVKNANIKPIFEKIQTLLPGKSITFTHVYREDNKLADEQVNICLDSQALLDK